MIYNVVNFQTVTSNGSLEPELIIHIWLGHISPKFLLTFWVTIQFVWVNGFCVFYSLSLPLFLWIYYYFSWKIRANVMQQTSSQITDRISATMKNTKWSTKKKNDYFWSFAMWIRYVFWNEVYMWNGPYRILMDGNEAGCFRVLLFRTIKHTKSNKYPPKSAKISHSPDSFYSLMTFRRFDDY